jgi:hypothetical protein
MLRALRDPLRTTDGATRLPCPAPSVADDATYAVDVAVLRDADVLAARRELDELGRRLTAVEKRFPQRLSRGVLRVSGLFARNGTR